jgi:hypothetical protein
LSVLAPSAAVLSWGRPYVEVVDTATVITFPRFDADAGTPADTDTLEVGAAALAEINAAISLVTSRVARRVQLTALPFVEAAAAVGLANARAAGIAFRFDRADRAGVATVTIGPLDPVSLHPALAEWAEPRGR